MSISIEELVADHPTLLGENGLLFRQIDAYVEDFICNEFLKNDEYPRWKEELVGDEIEVDEFIDNIIHQTINSEDYEDSNTTYFEIPRNYRNAHGVILKYISLSGIDGYDDEFKIDEKFIFDGDRACSAYAFWWLNNNREWLTQKLQEFRLSCIEEEAEEEEDDDNTCGSCVKGLDVPNEFGVCGCWCDVCDRLFRECDCRFSYSRKTKDNID
jgi:hypothetical protein